MCVVKYESCDLVNFARIISGDSRLDLSKQLKSNMELYGIGKSDVDEEDLVFSALSMLARAEDNGNSNFSNLHSAVRFLSHTAVEASVRLI